LFDMLDTPEVAGKAAPAGDAGVRDAGPDGNVRRDAAFGPIAKV
jgi:hypothetical protein